MKTHFVTGLNTEENVREASKKIITQEYNLKNLMLDINILQIRLLEIRPLYTGNFILYLGKNQLKILKDSIVLSVTDNTVVKGTYFLGYKVIAVDEDNYASMNYADISI